MRTHLGRVIEFRPNNTVFAAIDSMLSLKKYKKAIKKPRRVAAYYERLGGAKEGDFIWLMESKGTRYGRRWRAVKLRDQI